MVLAHSKYDRKQPTSSSFAVFRRRIWGSRFDKKKKSFLWWCPQSALLYYCCSWFSFPCTHCRSWRFEQNNLFLPLCSNIMTKCTSSLFTVIFQDRIKRRGPPYSPAPKTSAEKSFLTYSLKKLLVRKLFPFKFTFDSRTIKVPSRTEPHALSIQNRIKFAHFGWLKRTLSPNYSPADDGFFTNKKYDGDPYQTSKTRAGHTSKEQTRWREKNQDW